MKKLSLLAIVTVLSAIGYTNAQVSSYTFSSAAGTYTPITGGTAIRYGNAVTNASVTTATLDDDVYYNRPIGFSFSYNGSVYTSFGFNSNGWLILGNSTTFSSTSTPISTTTASTNNLISAGAVDLFGGIEVAGTVISGNNFITTGSTSPTTGINVGDSISGTGIPTPGAVVTAVTGTTVTIDKNTTSGSTSAAWRAKNGEIRYETIGTSPNRALVLQFSGFARFSTSAPGDRLSFQIKLNETTNTAQVVYSGWSSTYTGTGLTLQTGLKGTTSADYNNRTTTTNWSASTAGTTNTAAMTYTSTVLPADGLTYTWTPLPTPTVDLTVTAIAPSNSILCPTSNYPVLVTIQNIGTNTIDFSSSNAAIAVAITGASPQNLNTTVSNGTLASGASRVITITPGANLSTSGLDSIRATVTISGDGNNNNNTLLTTVTVSATGTTPLNEGFATTTAPNGWTITGWIIGSTRGVTGNPGNNIYKNLYSSSPSGEFSTIAVGTIASTDSLKFDYKLVNYATPYDAPAAGWGNYKVQVSTDCGTTYTTIDSVTNSTATWITKSYPLSTYSGQRLKVRILASWTAGDWDLAFDNIKIETPLPCSTPNNVSVGSITSTTTNVSFTSTGNSFIVEYGATGFTPGTGNTAGTGGTVVTGTASPISLTGLNPATTYQVYIRQNCTTASNGYSNNSSATSFTTSVLPPVNDLPSAAITLTVDAGCTGATYTNVGATLSTGEPFPSCSGTAQTPIWFKFVAPASGAIRVSTDAGSGNTFTDSKIALFSTNNPTDYTTFSIISCDDDGGSILGSGFMSVLYATGLTSGTTYYVAVDKYSNSTVNGTFCITVSTLDSSMISRTNTCATTLQTPASSGTITTYTGWVPLLDASSKLVALVQNPAGGAVSAYTVNQNVNTGAVRNSQGTYYLDRNFRIANSSATNVNVQLFFLQSELAALSAVDPLLTLANLGVTRQTERTAGCSNSFDTSRGPISFIAQTGNGTAGQVSWINFMTPGFSNFYLHRNGTSLPIKFEYLTGKKAGSTNALNWKVTCTSTSITMVLERSADARNFNQVVTSISATQARCGQPFDAVDATPINGINYYRLKMIDVDGKVSYSPVAAVLNGKAGAELVGVYPTVVKDQAYLSVTSSRNTTMQFSISDMSGKVIKTINQSVSSGSSMLPVSTSTLASGVYNITGLLDGVRTQTLRFVKQ